MLEYAGIHLLDNPYFIDSAYDYFIPPDLRGTFREGDFVTVPFGNANHRRIGLVVALKDAPDNRDKDCKPILSVCDRRMSLNEEMRELCFFMKEQTLCTVGDAVRAMIPASVLSHLEEVYRFAGTDTPTQREGLDPSTVLIGDFIRKRGSVRLDLLKTRFGPATEGALKKLIAAELIKKDFEIRTSGEKSEPYCALAIDRERADAILKGIDPHRKLRSATHLAILRYLVDSEEEEHRQKDLLAACHATGSQITALCDKGLVRRVQRSVDRSVLIGEKKESKPLVLNEEQSAALSTLQALSDSEEAKAALLHGVTGSGKTSVMMKTIDHVLAKGKSVILLLPEIALTPQTLDIFCSRYGKRVAIIHSGLSAGERFDTHRRIRNGGADVVIGTRSAVFAPLDNLGLIVIDEEQEHTYKSDMNPKYHARDIARYRCAHHKALMLLASATPSLESYYKARQGKYTLISMKNRYGGASLPRVTVADMRQESGSGSLSPLGSLLCSRLVENQQKGNQSILFLNRRGYNNFISCRSCGEALRCPTCSVSMTYHTLGNTYDRGELRCHWCGRRMPSPSVCPSCQSPHLTKMGFGTQRVEQELGELLPNAKLLRMDTDTTSSRYSYEEMLGAFRRNDADVLLGTQMVTKGHDFPNVTLVGVLLADASLYLDDYRAAERTFAMLTQVIGRAGRAQKAGEAVIQTNNPNSECIRYACNQDYESFYQAEIRLRHALVFPPFCDIVLLVLTCPDEKELLKASGILARMLKRALEDKESGIPAVVFGPFEAPVYKVENKYRMRMVVKCRLNKQSRALFAQLLREFSKSASTGTRGLTLSIDFNPSTL
ncbi:MAG: primosomal protein N' [Clostridia bacterium]|nr:primosomal protein N' [Clostridia bacterium]